MRYHHLRAVSNTLHILIVDDRPESVIFLTQFLSKKSHHVTMVASGKEALGILARQKEPKVDLVITEASLPGMDGLALLREIRLLNIPVETAICTSNAQLHPNLHVEARRLGSLVVLGKPAEVAELDKLLLSVAWDKVPSARPRDDQPFFGTSRKVNAEDVKTARVHLDHPATPATAASPGEKSTPAAPTSDPFSEADAQAERKTGSGMHRRGTGGILKTGSGSLAKPPTEPHVPPPAATPVAPEAVVGPPPGGALGMERPLAPVTTRVRRSISGTERIVRNPAPGEQAGPSRAVACAGCGQAFMVMARPSPYSVVCVHCGQINRVDPIPPSAAPPTA